MPDYKSHVPKPVMALAIVCSIFGVSGLMRAIALTGFNTQEIIAAAPEGQLSATDQQLITLLFAGLIHQILMLVAGISLFLFKPWSRMVALVYAAFAVGFAFTSFMLGMQFQGQESAIPPSTLGIELAIRLIIPVAMFLVLMNGDIIVAFKRGTRDIPTQPMGE